MLPEKNLKQITSRFDNLLKGYDKFEGKFVAFNHIRRQEIGDGELDDVKNEVHELNDKVDITNTNMSGRFTKLENEIRKLIKNSTIKYKKYSQTNFAMKMKRITLLLTGNS